MKFYRRILVFSLPVLLACGSWDRDNPSDPGAKNYHFLSIIAMQDTVVAINDSFFIHATGSDSLGTIVKYLWALDGISYRDSTDSGRIKAVFSIAGIKTVLVKAVDDNGLASNADSMKVTAKGNAPINISPLNSSSVNFTRPVLIWKPGLYSASFKVLLDTANPPVATALTSTTDSSCVPAADLPYGKTYYWQVIGANALAQEAQGEIWHFNTPPQPSWHALGGGMSFTVFVVAVDGLGNLYAGGNLSGAGVEKWNGSDWSSVGSGLTASVYSLAISGSETVYANGFYWNGGSWSSTGGGFSTYVYCLAFDKSGNLYACGTFTQAGSTAANHIARWDGGSWTPLGSGMNKSWVSTLAVDSFGNVYAGGRFDTAGGVHASNIAKWDGNAWSALGSGTNGDVYSLVADGKGNLYAGGAFTTAGGTAASFVAKWNGSTWSSLGTGMVGNSPGVQSLVLDGSGNLYAGGTFTSAGGVAANYIAKWNGSSWSALGTGMNTAVYSMAIDNSGTLYAGGSFTSAGGANANYIAAWK